MVSDLTCKPELERPGDTAATMQGHFKALGLLQLSVWRHGSPDLAVQNGRCIELAV